MVRYENWPLLLSQFLKERMKMPFEWGVNDCVAFPAKGVEALTGIDFYAPNVSYTTEAEARALIESKGGVIEMISECLGKGHTDVLKACRGDVVIIKGTEMSGGLVDDTGSKIAVVSPRGLIRLPLSSALRVWSY